LGGLANSPAGFPLVSLAEETLTEIARLLTVEEMFAEGNVSETKV
jgi:hypothetical protein